MKLKSYMATASLAAGLLIANSADAQNWVLSGNSPLNTDTLGNKTNQALNIITNNTSRIFIRKTGEVGIGTTNPTVALHVEGAGPQSMLFKSSTAAANVLVERVGPGFDAALNYRENNTNIWKSGMLTNSNYSIRNTVNSTNPVTILQTNDRVGINKLNPVARLDVASGTGSADTINVIQGISGYVGNLDIRGIYGESTTTPEYGYGVEGFGNWVGVSGIGLKYGGFSFGYGGDTTVATGTDVYGIFGQSSTALYSIGVDGLAGGGQNNYGVYGETANGLADTVGNKNWAGFFVGDIAYARAYTFSDGRLKTNIQPITNALDNLNKLTTATYNFKRKEYPDLSLPSGKQIGFLAENVETVFPELVKEATSARLTDKNRKVIANSVTFKAVNYVGLIPVVVEAIKEQSQLAAQKEEQTNARIAQLENQIAELKTLLVERQGNVIESGYLMQNVPNPANGNTAIKFYLPKNSNGTLQVTDVNGKVVKLFNVNGSGIQQVELNTAALASGSYTYTLSVNGKVSDSKSLVITK